MPSNLSDSSKSSSKARFAFPFYHLYHLQLIDGLPEYKSCNTNSPPSSSCETHELRDIPSRNHVTRNMCGPQESLPVGTRASLKGSRHAIRKGHHPALDLVELTCIHALAAPIFAQYMRGIVLCVLLYMAYSFEVFAFLFYEITHGRVRLAKTKFVGVYAIKLTSDKLILREVSSETIPIPPSAAINFPRLLF